MFGHWSSYCSGCEEIKYSICHFVNLPVFCPKCDTLFDSKLVDYSMATGGQKQLPPTKKHSTDPDEIIADLRFQETLGG